MTSEHSAQDGYPVDDGEGWYSAEDASRAVLERRPHPRPSRDRLDRRFIDGPPRTTPREPEYHAFVDQLLAEGYRFDMAAGEWVSADGSEYGRAAWDSEAYWLDEPGTHRRLHVTPIGTLRGQQGG